MQLKSNAMYHVCERHVMTQKSGVEHMGDTVHVHAIGFSVVPYVQLFLFPYFWQSL